MITLNNTRCGDHFTKYIYINKTSLSPEFCDIVISLYENPLEIKEPGRVISGIDNNVKKTHDLMTRGEKWNSINSTLIRELKHNVDIYSKSLQNDDYKGEHNHSTYDTYNIINPSRFIAPTQFMVQKYNKQEGRYIYHHDYSISLLNKSQRILTYLWYLNDVEEGGETTFSGIYNIKPKCGTLTLFPASWTFPHCGKMPISSDKYIITGWIYEEIKNDA